MYVYNKYICLSYNFNFKKKLDQFIWFVQFCILQIKLNQKLKTKILNLTN